MSAVDTAQPPPRASRGLAVRLFAALIVLGAFAVLLTGGIGYLRARDSLEISILNKLTAVRETKERQVETYFRTIGNDLRLLAASKMVLEAARDFRAAYAELDEGEPAPELRRKVDDWYANVFLPPLQRVLGSSVAVADLLPVGAAAYHLQYQYIVANPQPAHQRKLIDDAGDGSAYSRAHATFHPLMRNAAATVGFFDMMLADPKTGRILYAVEKETDFATSLRIGPHRQSNVAAAVARCAVAPDRATLCLEDFAPYIPSGGAPTAFMAAPVFDQGVVVAVLIAQLSIEEIDNVVTGNRRWRQDGLGTTGEAYLVGPDFLARSGVRAFYEDRNAYYESLEDGGMPAAEIEAIRRYGTPVHHQRIDTPAVRSALAGVDGTGEIVGYRGTPTLASWGPLHVPGLKWALVAKIESSEAFAPVDSLRRDLLLVGGLALLAVVLIGAWLAHAMLGPLHELTAGVRRFATGDYGAKVAVRSRDEIGQLCTAFNGMVDELREKNAIIERKNRENEDLLLNVLPAPIANRLRGGEQSIADGFAEVTVAFADIVGFTALSSDMPPHGVVTLLNGLFSRFDTAAHELGIEKIKTVGDAYMAVSGLSEPAPNHSERMMRMAIRMIHITREHALEHQVELRLRIGINCGPVVAGVIGKSKYIYDLWGDTVNLASRMEAGGLPDTIQVTRPVYEQLASLFAFEPRGPIEVKGKGSVEAWLVRM